MIEKKIKSENNRLKFKMKTEFDFFKTIMPESRKADYYLGCLDGCVFIDFNRTSDNLIYLRRISFDGYGCCDLQDKTKILNIELSKEFLIEIDKDVLEQEKMIILVKEIIKINKEEIWIDALIEYDLIDNE